MHNPASPYFAAIDLGSNSFHMIICRVNDHNVEVLDRVKEMVQIAKGMSSEGIAKEAHTRAISCLERFSERLKNIPAQHIRAVGTKSLRSAKNAYAFLIEAEQALNHPIDIISGYEEARLVYKGLYESVTNDTNQRLVIDIGGASTEFVIGHTATPQLLESMDFGCIAYTEAHKLLESLNQKNMDSAYFAARTELQLIRPIYTKHGWEVAYGTSGTMKAIAELLTDIDGGAIIREQSLSRLYQEIIEDTDRILNNTPRPRKDVLPAGVAILKAIFDEFRIDKIHIADASLKDGLIYDTIGRLRNSDPRQGAVEQLQNQYRVDLEQGIRVSDCASRLLEQIVTLPLPGISRSKILRWAAQLHEVGLGISHSSHHNHSYYILRHSDLAGFGRYEQTILANLVRCHRKKLHMDRLEGLDRKAKLAIIPLIMCLRLAVILNRQRENMGMQPELIYQEGVYQLIIPPEWLEVRPLTAEGLLTEKDQLANLNVTLLVQQP